VAGKIELAFKFVRPAAGQAPKANRRTDFVFDPPILFFE
jgi:hypothetical protein